MFFYDHVDQTDDDDDYGQDNEGKVEDVGEFDDDDYRADYFVEQEGQSHVSIAHWSGKSTLITIIIIISTAKILTIFIIMAIESQTKEESLKICTKSPLIIGHHHHYSIASAV